MKTYEITFIVQPTLEEASINKIAEDLKKLLEKNGAKIVEEKKMGQKDLAYEIKKHLKGYYFYLCIEADANAISEFNRITNVNEDILRTLVIKKEI